MTSQRCSEKFKDKRFSTSSPHILFECYCKVVISLLPKMINLRKDDGVADVIILIKTQAAHQLPHGLTDAAGYEYAEHDLKVNSIVFVVVVDTKENFTAF